MVKRGFFYLLLILSLVITMLPEVSSAKPKKIKLSKRNVTLNRNESCKIKLKAAKKKKIKWYSTNKKIVSVKDGLIKAKKKGKCIVIAKYRGKEYRCNVLVKEMKSTSKAPGSSAKLPAKTPSVSQSLRITKLVRASNQGKIQSAFTMDFYKPDSDCQAFKIFIEGLLDDF